MRLLSHALCIIISLASGATFAELPGRLVDAQWLLAQKSDSQLIVVDVRSPSEYTAGHIAGAISLPLRHTFGKAPHSDQIASHRDIARLLGNAGIGNDDTVVIYDSGIFIDAARALWVFEVYGHAHVALLDGGLPGWQSIQGPMETRPSNRPRRQFIPTVDPARLATRLSTRLALDDPNAQLVDARTADEFTGNASKSRHRGHIPGAINVPAEANYELINGVPRMKQPEELRALYSSLDTSKRVITYCNKGRDSALTHFVLRELGYEVSAYDGGWFEWGNRDDTPIQIIAE